MFRKILLIATLLAFGCAKQNPKDAKSNTYGEEMKLTESHSLNEVLTKPDEFSGKHIRIDSQISSVCQAKGCWMILTEESGKEIRVTFKDYGFFVPKDSKGKKVSVEGDFAINELSEEDAKHYASESEGKVNPDSIQGSQKEFSLVANAVVIYEN
ncbi:DUF4920 domain-containing protein [bacterium]|nr:DUF4920 domain-containing protein [bacterium]